MIERVGDVGQKEIALDAAGLKRVRVYAEIKRMLEAVKVVEKMNSDGTITRSDEPDNAIRAKGVELALKAFGDLKEFDKAGVVNNFTFATMVKLAMTTVVPVETAVDKNRILDAN